MLADMGVLGHRRTDNFVRGASVLPPASDKGNIARAASGYAATGAQPVWSATFPDFAYPWLPSAEHGGDKGMVHPQTPPFE